MATHKRPPLEQCSAICLAVLQNIDRERKAYQPTPRKGQIVGWVNRYHKRADGQVEWQIAVVTDILAPGRIACEILGFPQKILRHSVVYVHHPERLRQPGIQMGDSGAWFYADIMYDETFQPPTEDFQFHRQLLDQREARCLADEDQRVKDALERQKFREQVAVAEAAPSKAK